MFIKCQEFFNKYIYPSNDTRIVVWKVLHFKVTCFEFKFPNQNNINEKSERKLSRLLQSENSFFSEEKISIWIRWKYCCLASVSVAVRFHVTLMYAHNY